MTAIIATGCCVYGCGKPSIANGYCDTHRKRLERHGHVLQTRPADWGLRERHPLYDSWRHFSRTNTLPPEWSDFWDFVKEVKERPEGALCMAKIEEEKPFGPGNWYWRMPVSSPAYRLEKAAQMREYTKMRREKDPWHEFRSSLKRYYGITVEQYLDIHDSQGGVCAICGKAESSVDPKTGRVRRLAVDHDHASGAIRGLLCKHCNTALGQFQDSVQVLSSAIGYLEKHQRNT